MSAFFSPFCSDLISDALPFDRRWYAAPTSISYAKFYNRSHDTVIRVYDDARNVIETQEHGAISVSGELAVTPTKPDNT